MLHFMIVALLMAPASGFAQSIADQINAVDQAHQQERVTDKRLERQEEIAAEKARQAAELERLKAQSFEDQHKQLDLEERNLDLEHKRAKAKRADEYIDNELEHQDAQTDVVKAKAGAITDLFSGAGKALSGWGEGAAKK